jgi:hypothetical protein
VKKEIENIYIIITKKVISTSYKHILNTMCNTDVAARDEQHSDFEPGPAAAQVVKQ